MCWTIVKTNIKMSQVSVAGCLGYDVLESIDGLSCRKNYVSVAGCLGYDVLAHTREVRDLRNAFQLLVV